MLLFSAYAAFHSRHFDFHSAFMPPCRFADAAAADVLRAAAAASCRSAASARRQRRYR
jgi:hypothetical protein